MVNRRKGGGEIACRTEGEMKQRRVRHSHWGRWKSEVME